MFLPSICVPTLPDPDFKAPCKSGNQYCLMPSTTGEPTTTQP